MVGDRAVILTGETSITANAGSAKRRFTPQRGL